LLQIKIFFLFVVAGYLRSKGRFIPCLCCQSFCSLIRLLCFSVMRADDLASVDAIADQ
jgi:hypothetical protein